MGGAPFEFPIRLLTPGPAAHDKTRGGGETSDLGCGGGREGGSTSRCQPRRVLPHRQAGWKFTRKSAPRRALAAN